MKKNRKLLRILLTCVLLIGLQPMAAFAEDTNTRIRQSIPETTTANNPTAVSITLTNLLSTEQTVTAYVRFQGTNEDHTLTLSGFTIDGNPVEEGKVSEHILKAGASEVSAEPWSPGDRFLGYNVEVTIPGNGAVTLAATAYATAAREYKFKTLTDIDTSYTKTMTVSEPKENEPGMEKKIVVKDEEGNDKLVDHLDVKPGDTVTFQLKSNVPDNLGSFIPPEEPGKPTVMKATAFEPEIGKYVLTFHDKLDSNMTFNKDSLTVTVNGKTLDSSLYTVTTENLEDGCTFHVTMDLVAIYNAKNEDGTHKYFSFEDIENNPAIIVTYNATVNEGTAHGAYSNEAWVDYESKESEKPKVYVHVYAIDVFKYDQRDYSFVLCFGDTFRSGGTYVSVVVNGQKVITTKDRFAFEGDGSTAQMIESFIANNPGSEGANEHQWGYMAEAVEGKPNCVRIIPLTMEKVISPKTETCKVVGLGGYTLGEGPEKPIAFNEGEPVMHTALPGAEFALYSDKDCTQLVATGTSDENGMIVFESLEPGTYYLKETKAPDGYIKSDTVLEVKIEATESTENTAHIVHTKFANSDIPHTGGPGTMLFTIGGLLLLVTAGAVFLSRKRDGA